ncbi:hypothetical protein BDF22DRAFT_703511 [Syncephalis plumigaleata]|nr:hypothetical protein BDF22DRAFT_703511 [Syncephalis plumigaleata]
MTRLTSTFGSSLCAIGLLALTAVSSVAGHGHMSSPTPRGIEKLTTNIDDLNNPNSKGLCRGEPEGKVTSVSGSVTLQFDITAKHIGQCIVYLLDTNLGNQQKIAEKQDCVTAEKGGPWTVKLPAGVSGRKVLRWYWKATHLAPNFEYFENCADIDIGGGGGGGSSDNKEDSAPPSEGGNKRKKPSDEGEGTTAPASEGGNEEKKSSRGNKKRKSKRKPKKQD